MCCPIWPVKDIEYEAAPRVRNIPTQTAYRYQWNGSAWDLQQVQVPAGSSSSSTGNGIGTGTGTGNQPSNGESELDKAWMHRAPTPYAITRQDLYDSDEEVGPSNTTTTTTTHSHHSNKHRKNQPTYTSSPAIHPGIQPYNNPAGTTPQLGQNHIYHHVVAPANSYYPGHHFVNIANPSAPTHHAVNFVGQPQPIVYINKDGIMAYQNAAPPNAGVHFQPQTPDTTHGPMLHHYIPRHDGGIAYATQPGIAPQGVAVPLQTGPATAPMVVTPVQQGYQGPQPMMYAGGVGPVAVGGNPNAISHGVMPMTGGFIGGGGGVPPGQPVFLAAANGGMPQPVMPGTFPPMHNEPATGIGMTAGEVAAAHMMDPEINEPQDFQPADPNPARMYMVRQLDGQYIAMSRATIDSFGPTGARWYLTDDGIFYAVRLEP